ncbi:rhodopsin [Halobacteriales archaeon QS_5_70_15]|jgi:bacteriorhodopsin|nr:MAG: rhodopsin [Halobacteriales archaeon QS_4_70_19]PSQ11282.1 MAG: rhodopsin [Halobacteriales archaeon QS_5_70_15]
MSAPPSGSLEQLALGIGTLGMALGTIAFIAMGSGETNERKQEFFIITTFIAGIAAVSYFSMYQGFGVLSVELADGTTLDRIYWARYTDWLFTTPLLLLDLGLLAGADRNTLATLIGLDVGMIVTGLVGALATGGGSSLSPGATRIAWWGISCGFFVVLLYYLVSTLSGVAAQRSGDVASLFGTLRNLVIVLWTAYPIVWIIGTEGTLNLIGLGVETVLFMVLDLSAKVGFGFILLRSRDVLDQAASASEAAAAD